MKSNLNSSVYKANNNQTNQSTISIKEIQSKRNIEEIQSTLNLPVQRSDEFSKEFFHFKIFEEFGLLIYDIEIAYFGHFGKKSENDHHLT